MDWNWIYEAPSPEEVVLLGWNLSVDLIRAWFFLVKGFLARIAIRLSDDLPNSSGGCWVGRLEPRMTGRSPSQAEPRRPESKGSGVTASAFRGVPWFSDVEPQSIALCVRTPDYGRTKPGLLELRNRYGRSFESTRRGP